MQILIEEVNSEKMATALQRNEDFGLDFWNYDLSFEPNKKQANGNEMTRVEQIEQEMMQKLEGMPEMKWNSTEEGGILAACERTYAYLRINQYNLVNYDEACKSLFGEEKQGCTVEEQLRYWLTAYEEIQNMAFRREQLAEIARWRESGGQRDARLLLGQEFSCPEMNVARDWARVLMANRNAKDAETSGWQIQNFILDRDQSLPKPRNRISTVAEDIVQGGSMLYQSMTRYFEGKPRSYRKGKQWPQGHEWVRCLLFPRQALTTSRAITPIWYQRLKSELRRNTAKKMFEDGNNDEAFTQYVRAEGEYLVLDDQNTLFKPPALAAMINARCNLARRRNGRAPPTELKEAYEDLQRVLTRIQRIEERAGGEVTHALPGESMFLHWEQEEDNEGVNEEKRMQ